MPSINHDSLLSLVPTTSAASTDWATTLRRSDDVYAGTRNNRKVDSHEAWWAQDVAARGAPNMYPGEAKAVGLLAEIAAPFRNDETVIHIADGEPVFDIVMPAQVAIADIGEVNTEYAAVAARIASTPPGQEQTTPTHLTFEECKRASGDNTLTLSERGAASGILREFFVANATGASSEPVEVTAFNDGANALSVTVERSIDQVRIDAASVSYQLNNRALELEAPVGTMILVELASSSRWDRKVSESVVTVPAAGKVRVETNGLGAWLAFVKPGVAGELPTVIRRVRLKLPSKTYGETRL